MSETSTFTTPTTLSGAPLSQPLVATRTSFKGGALQLQEHFRTLVTAPNDHFDRLFTRDATGVIAGKSVSRDGLKAALLALNKEWSPASCRFGPATCLDGFVRLPFYVKLRERLTAFTIGRDALRFHAAARVRVHRSRRSRPVSSFPGTTCEPYSQNVCIACRIRPEGGAERISSLELDGEESLFAN